MRHALDWDSFVCSDCGRVIPRDNDGFLRCAQYVINAHLIRFDVCHDCYRFWSDRQRRSS